jgi:hypothetical protein
MSDQVVTIDVTPTWGEVGNMYKRFAETGEGNAARAMHADLAKAFAFAEAFRVILPQLPGELREAAKDIVRVELRKQGIAGN